MVTGSLSLCMRKCTPSSVSLACLLPSRSKFKGLSGGHPNVHQHQNQNHVGHQMQGMPVVEKHLRVSNLSPKGALPLKGVFQGPGVTKRAQKLRAGKKHPKNMTSAPNGGRGRGSKRNQPPSSASESSSSGDVSGSGSESDSRPSSPEPSASHTNTANPDNGSMLRGPSWHSRRRDSRINGADLYVARITKNGCGNAKPCWRCLEWCRWAGIKRIFHWNMETNSFDVVKVNNAEALHYETHADFRLFAGLVSILPIPLVLISICTHDRLFFRDGEYLLDSIVLFFLFLFFVLSIICCIISYHLSRFKVFFFPLLSSKKSSSHSLLAYSRPRNLFSIFFYLLSSPLIRYFLTSTTIED